MKKTISLLLITALALTLAACAEDINTDPSRVSLEKTVASVRSENPRTVATTPAPTTPTVAELDELEQWNSFGDYMLTYAAQFRWLSTALYADGVMHERAWNERYKTVFEMTFEEAMQAFNAKFDSFEYVTTEVWNSIDCEIFHAYAEITHEQPVWGWRVNNLNEPTQVRVNQPEFLEILRYFNVTQDEFQREHERRLMQNARIETLDTDPNNRATKVDIFPTEQIDILFSGDITAIKRAALNPWSIMVEDRVYSAQWLIDNTPEQWAAEGIPADVIESRREAFYAVLDESQFAEFAAELDVFSREYADS
jgi:hypothetical protein